MKPRIFISSTYEDLKQYRARLWDDLSTLDIKILGMEKFGARSSAPLETCLEEVRKADIYIGILAYRYGSVDVTSGKSFTQIEYELALERKIEVLIYLFDENGKIEPRYVDKGETAIRLEQFKNVVKKHTWDTYSDPNELSMKVFSRLREILPNLPRGFLRPKQLYGKIHRFKIDGSPWMAFVGHYNNCPYEIFTGEDSENYPIPKSVNSGLIIEVKDEEGQTRYDFQYTDKYGYKNTVGGLSHIFNEQMSAFNNIITKLLKDDISLTTILNIIDDMKVYNIQNPEEWRNGVKEALIVL